MPKPDYFEKQLKAKGYAKVGEDKFEGKMLFMKIKPSPANDFSISTVLLRYGKGEENSANVHVVVNPPLWDAGKFYQGFFSREGEPSDNSPETRNLISYLGLPRAKKS